MWWLVLVFILLIVVKLWPKGLWVFFLLAGVALAAVLLSTRLAEKRLAAVTLDVEYAVHVCPAERPMRVTITNNSDKSLTKLSFALNAREPGYSTEITPYTYRRAVSEKIIPPGESFTDCFEKPLLQNEPSLRTPPEDLEWFARPDKGEFD